MKDDYQIGSDLEWLKHSNEELARLLKKRQRQLAFSRLLSGVLLLLVVWVAYKLQQNRPLSDLWKF